MTIAGVESNYGVHHSQFSVFNALYSQIHEIPRRRKWATRTFKLLSTVLKDKLDTQEIVAPTRGLLATDNSSLQALLVIQLTLTKTE